MAHGLYYPLLVLSITIASSLTGCQLSLSYVSINAILNVPEAPEHTFLTMWRVAFEKGFWLCPTQAFLCCFTFTSNAFLTFFTRNSPSYASKSAWPLLIGSILSVSLVPFTIMHISPIEEILLTRHNILSEETGVLELDDSEDAETHIRISDSSPLQSRQLIQRWAFLNYVRTLFPAMTALWGLALCR